MECNDAVIGAESKLIENSKILAMHKFKSKKLKKRLSEKHSLLQQNLGTTRHGHTKNVDLHYQYGFSVDEQKRDGAGQGGQVIRVTQPAILRNGARHTNSHNISNLIAQSVRGQTPSVFSKIASTERLPKLPNARETTLASTKKPKASSLHHSKMISFTEKAAGVVSERNRKFQKPMTLKNLKQKLLQAEDDAEMDLMITDDELDGGSQSKVEMFRLNIPVMEHSAEKVILQSDMISINEYESGAEDDEHGEVVPVTSPFRVSPCLKDDDVNVSSDEADLNTSPVLQFQSQSMTDIRSPLKNAECPAQVKSPKERKMLSLVGSISSPNFNK